MLVYAEEGEERMGLFSKSGKGQGKQAVSAWFLLLLAVFLVSTAMLCEQSEAATPNSLSAKTIVQPGPLKKGPGSKKYNHRSWRVSEGGEGYNAWYAFEPVKPRPSRAPLAIVTHGYGEFAGYDRLFELIRHTVLKGNVVIFPRWQTSDFVPCPGPFHIEACMNSAVTGIHDALDFLQGKPNRVQPDLARTSYYGYSFGGIITANITNQYRRYDLPRPRAIFLDDPHDGEVAGLGEPALDDSLDGIPSQVKFACHSGADGVLGVPRLIDGSCNAVFPKLDKIPARNKVLTMTRTDSWGTPTLNSAHGVCASNPGQDDAYDWRFCWRDWDAIRSCAYKNRNCDLALGTGRKHSWLGRWSDGTPVTRLKIQKSAPIHP